MVKKRVSLLEKKIQELTFKRKMNNCKKKKHDYKMKKKLEAMNEDHCTKRR
jgi:hypothetical protein